MSSERSRTIPIFAIPAVGSALEAGNGEAAMLVIAGFLALAGLLNLRPPSRRTQVPGSP